MVDLVMRKRPAMHAGEIGLFIDTQVFEEEFEHIKAGTDIQVKATQARNLKQMRLGWAIAGVVEKSGALGDVDKREVMDYILMKCKHVKYVSHTFPSGLVEIIPVVKSIRFAAMDGTDFNRLFNRMIYVVITDIIPQMEESYFRAKVEDLSGIGAPEPETKRVSRRRRPLTLPAPVSVIPADEPVTAAVPSGPVSEGRPSDTGIISDPKVTDPQPSAQPARFPQPRMPRRGRLQFRLIWKHGEHGRLDG